LDNEAVLIPWADLETPTLDNLLSEIVTRDGTDYGAIEKSTEAKVAAAKKALEKGRAVLYWNVESETSALISIDEIREHQEEYAALAKACGVVSTTDNEPST